MRKLLLALALVAGTMLIGGSPASAADGQFETNHTVSVPANGTVTYVRSCNESSSNPGGGTAAGGRAEFNETGDGGVLSVVSEGITEDGTGYFTTVKNTADRAYAYLSWAVCDPIPVVEVPPRPDKVHTDEAVESAPNCDTGKVTITNTHTKTGWKLNAEGIDWVQRQPVVTVTETTRDATAEECPVVEPPVEDEPVVVPPVDDEEPPAVTPPVVEVETPPAKVEVVTPPAVVKVIEKPVVEKRVVAQKVAQPVSERGVLPNTGGPNALYITSAAILLAMGSGMILLARRDRRTN